MTQQELKKLACELSAVSVFRNVLQSREVSFLLQFLKSEGALEQMEGYGAFVHSLEGRCFSERLSRRVFEDENAYVKAVAKGEEPSAALRENTDAELSLFTRLTALTAEELCEPVEYDGYIPRFENRMVDLRTVYEMRMSRIHKFGYGIFATACMFKVTEDGIAPVEAADSIGMDHFVGYDEERRKVLDNTRALVEGRPAANVLLCGDAGTGKSSTVKACANYFYGDGVRLIELRKDQLFSLPYVMGRIADNPLKFIIFIDDLSFNKNDDSFSMLKAALEGSASAKAPNAVIYATSNRRHLVKESFSERGVSDDVHRSDTMQEQLSLSERFGLTVWFSRPQKALYLEIVHALARRSGIEPDAELDIKAEAFALKRGSRSPRAAEHFVKSLM